MSRSKNAYVPSKAPGGRLWIASMLLDHVTTLVAMSQDQTPTSPASSAARTIARSGKNAAALSSGARSGSVVVVPLTSGLSMLLQFDLLPTGVKAVRLDY